MENFHPATCVACCKRIVDARRKHPVLVDDWGYICRELWLFAMSFGTALIFGPLWILHCTFAKSRRHRRINDDVTVVLHDLPGLPDPEDQILYRQRLVLESLVRLLKRAERQDVPWILREIEKRQEIHNRYAAELDDRFPGDRYEERVVPPYQEPR
jgi:hypothetical protein